MSRLLPVLIVLVFVTIAACSRNEVHIVNRAATEVSVDLQASGIKIWSGKLRTDERVIVEYKYEKEGVMRFLLSYADGSRYDVSKGYVTDGVDLYLAIGDAGSVSED